jgi:hypothetical protein
MMATALVPYRWKTDDGMPHWALPDNVTSAIDLRPTATHVHLTALGYAVAVVDGELPEGAIELGAGNATRDRDAWERALFFRPSGDTVEEMVWSHLTDGADDDGEAACRPLRCHRPDRLELHLGGRKERQTTATERLKQAVLIRADLARMVDDETIPRRMLGKFLQAEADRMGIDAVTLRGKGAKLRDIRPERPETSFTDTFRDNAEFIFLSAHTPSGAGGAWTVAGENGNRFQTGNSGDGLGSKLYFDGGGGGISIGNASNYGWHPTSLSSSNNVAVLESVTRNGGQPALGPIIRGNGSTSGYTCDNASATVLRAFSLVSNVGTSLGTATRSVQTRDDLRAGASGSSIYFNDQATGISLQVSNTAVTVGLRVGVHGYSGGGESQATGFSAQDDVPTASRGRRARLLKRPVFWLP